MTEDEMGEQNHQINGREFEQTPGNSVTRQGSLAMLQSMGLQRIGNDLMTEQQHCV